MMKREVREDPKERGNNKEEQGKKIKTPSLKSRQLVNCDPDKKNEWGGRTKVKAEGILTLFIKEGRNLKGSFKCREVTSKRDQEGN